VLVAILGDSIARGFGASNLNTTGWAAKLKTALQATYGDGGSGWQGSIDADAAMTAIVTTASYRTLYAAAGNQVATTGSWATSGPFGPGVTTITTTASGATATYTVRGTSVKLWYIQNTGKGTFNWTIDGVAQTAVNTAGAASTQSVTVSGLSSGSHTVVITSADTSGIFICGVSGENATGVVVHNFGRWGATSTTFNSSDTFGGTATYMGGSGNPADLVIFNAGVNDANASVASETYAENVERCLKTIRNGNSACDILMVRPHIGANDATTPFYATLYSRQRTLAETYGAALIDFHRLGRNSYNYWNGLGYFSDGTSGAAGSDPIHPSNDGHQFIARRVLHRVARGPPPVRGAVAAEPRDHDGKQWLAFDGRQLFEPQLEPWRAKLVDNRIRGLVRKEIARMNKTRPCGSACRRPATTSRSTPPACASGCSSTTGSTSTWPARSGRRSSGRGSPAPGS
jgi:lysophospholipase L1-like esterase